MRLPQASFENAARRAAVCARCFVLTAWRCCLSTLLSLRSVPMSRELRLRPLQICRLLYRWVLRRTVWRARACIFAALSRLIEVAYFAGMECDDLVYVTRSRPGLPEQTRSSTRWVSHCGDPGMILAQAQ